MCCRYRDTKMEIQGLSAAQNLQRQHGVSCRADLSRPGRRTGASCRTTPSDIGAADGLVLHEPESDDNNSGSRPGTSPFLLQENGSGGGPPAPERSNKNNTGARCVDAGLGLLVGLRGKGVGRHRPRRGCPDTGKRCGLEHGEGGLQMAFPVDLQQGSQQRPRCQPDRNPGLEESAAGPRAVTGCSAHIDGGAEEELFVVFNVARGGEGVASKEADSPDAVRSAAAEVQDASGRVRPGVSSVHLPPRNARKSRPTGAPPRSRPVGRCDVGVTPLRRGPEPETGEGDDDGDGGAMASRCSAERDGSEGDAGAIERIHTGQPGRSAAGDSAPFVEALPLSDGGSAHLSGGCIATGSANVTQSDDAFSGTITINNQSIVVTIENGVLTLAAPSEGHSQREDCSSLFSLKEHLGLKEHQDVVLISYDGTTKPAGRNGNATMGCVQYEESRTCLNVSDPGLALEEDCSFSDPGSVLADVHGSKEDGAFCALAQGDAVDSGSKDGAHGELMACDGLPSTKLEGCAGMVPKKGAPASYRCPQSDCGRTFDAKHKLKMHVLSHAEDQRPFKCPVEGCGWSFTTSYKLKRHLQSHDKARPFACEWENCGRRFTTVYNLKAHARAHGREGAFVCSTCSERFRSAARLGSHQRSHFEPERPHRCEFPGCEKTFITFSALFSHNRTHFRETGQFICNYPGCDKRYDKACRLKIHLRSHTGERPFVCDSEGCGWSFTSMSKLLRHKRKHEDDRRFICQQEGCGKSFTRAEHLKGHSITHLGTKPFECPVEGCTAKFSARSSLYIHSKKHQVDRPLRSRCPVSSCSKCFSSRGSLKSHMMKHHNLSPDLLSQLEMSTSLTPSSELTSTGPAAGDMDLGSLFSGGGTGVAGVPGTGGASALTMDMSLVSSGILTIDAASVSATLGGAGGALAQAVDPLILAAGAEVGPAGFDAGAGSVLPQGALNLEDVQTVNPEALGSLAALALRPPTGSEHLHALSSTSALASDPPAPLAPSSSLATSSGSGLLSAASEPDQSGRGGALLGGTDVLSQQEGSKVVTQFVFPGHGGSFSAQKDPELHAVPACSFLESGGSARTDYRAIQLAKKKKQKGPAGAPGSSVGQRKTKGGKGGGSSVMPGAPAGGRFSESVASASGGLTLRDPVTGAQYVQIQLLQDDPSGDGDLAFQLSSQTSSSHSQLTVDLPVNILQEPPVTAEDDTGSETSQFTGSTINLQDLE